MNINHVVYLASRMVMNIWKRKFARKQEQPAAGPLLTPGNPEGGELTVEITNTGIGLHICCEYAGARNESITVKSELGKGSTFCLSLPFHAESIHEIVSAPSPSPAPVREQPVKVMAVASLPSLLVVEDHTGFRSVPCSIPLTGNIQVSSPDDELIRKTIRFIEEQIATPGLSVERLSREMAMSRTNFYKKILSITGKTPLGLIRTIRMKYAAQLLENSRMRVSEVALQVGVNDTKLFRKYFKEEFGILPSELYSKKGSGMREHSS
ncbi:MAG: helix-turn-helix domain-containing protein [Tannerellaceae bacterium]|jgi:AraC-like DNA-binding protein|nr:helix-turn-helix domain-containing protein [Tannerellaceae bacterium]